MELQGRLDDIRRQGLGLAAVSYDPPEILTAFSRQHGIAFPLLSDAGSETIKRYGILNTVAEEAVGPRAQDPEVAAAVRKYVAGAEASAKRIGIPFPGTFLLDRAGRVTARFFEEAYTDRDTASNILVRLGTQKATVAATQVTTAHLAVKTYPSDAAIAPGNRFSLVIDIVPKPGMHVYAPGATYRVVHLAVAPQPGVRVLPLRYPESEIYEFKPLNERVPVYQRPFTLVQDVMLEATPEAQAALRDRQTLTLNGTLEYQACDDNLCFNPVTVPLSWTLTLRPLVRERPTVRR